MLKSVSSEFTGRAFDAGSPFAIGAFALVKRAMLNGILLQHLLESQSTYSNALLMSDCS